MTETYGAETLKVVCAKCRHVITEAVMVQVCPDGVHRMFCEACAQ